MSRATSSAVRTTITVADAFERVVGADVPVAFAAFDGSRAGTPGADIAVNVRSPRALSYLVQSPGELGLGRAYVAGDLEVEGDVYEALRAMSQSTLDKLSWRDRFDILKAFGKEALRPVAPPPQEVVQHGLLRHTKRRDAKAISHHYDVSNEFYSLVLGPSMTYSCAYFPAAATSLEDAQRAKYELVSRKLGLEPGMRLLDVGCGWGGMVLHAARVHGVSAVGVTLSKRQAEHARSAVEAAGLSHLVEIRHADYRDIADGPFDAISSIGMFEHVGIAKLTTYFTNLHRLLRPGGRLLNHAISRPSGAARLPRRSFVQHFVFPDGELLEVGRVVTAMQELGFEVRDVEGLREHYGRTLRAWVANLEHRWDEAVSLVGGGRARVWRLYMAASALNFEAGRTCIHQTLGVRPDSRGASGMPATRASWVAP